MTVYLCFTDEIFKTKIGKKVPLAVWRKININNLRELNNNETKKPQLICNISKNMSTLAKWLLCKLIHAPP